MTAADFAALFGGGFVASLVMFFRVHFEKRRIQKTVDRLKSCNRELVRSRDHFIRLSQERGRDLHQKGE